MPLDTIELLPDVPGVYLILNRATGRRWVGISCSSIRRRARQHLHNLEASRHVPTGMHRDLAAYGPSSFVFVTLEIADGLLTSACRRTLMEREGWWAEQLLTLDESHGYNQEAGGRRSRASLFRDHERKLMRARGGRYRLLPGRALFDPIHEALLRSWSPN